MHQLQLPQTSVSNAGITEVILADESARQLAMVLPMLAHMSNTGDARWVTWVAPPAISRESLQGYGFNLSRLRLVHTRGEEELLWVFWQALAQGNSHTVVASPGRLSEKSLIKLEQAAIEGDCQGLLIRYR